MHKGSDQLRTGRSWIVDRNEHLFHIIIAMILMRRLSWMLQSDIIYRHHYYSSRFGVFCGWRGEKKETMRPRVHIFGLADQCRFERGGIRNVGTLIMHIAAIVCLWVRENSTETSRRQKRR